MMKETFGSKRLYHFVDTVFLVGILCFIVSFHFVTAAISSASALPVADAGSDQVVNENEAVQFSGCRSYNPDGNHVLYTFDTSDEGFFKESDYSRSDVHWDSACGRVYLYSDRYDTGDERFVKYLPETFTEDSHDWQLSADFSVSQAGWWTHGVMAFICHPDNTELRWNSNQLSIIWERSNILGYSQNSIYAWYRASDGIHLGIMIYRDGKLNTPYTAKIYYNTSCRKFHVDLFEAGILVSTGEYAIGTRPNDGFTFGKLGVASNGIHHVFPWLPPEPPVVGWTDKIEFNYSAPLNYEWDFDITRDTDDDHITDNDIDATGAAPTFTWNDDYSSTVKLTVTDSDGLVTSDTMDVTVQNLDPSCDIYFHIISPSFYLLEAEAEDPGSDDLIISFFLNGMPVLSGITYYNDGIHPDLYPSPYYGIAPFSVHKSIILSSRIRPGSYLLGMQTVDDDGGSSYVEKLITVP